MRFVTAICPNEKCKNHEPFSSAKLLHESATEWFVECEECGTKFSRKAAEILKKPGISQYPYLSASLGEVVTSRDHENHVAKKMGMVPMEHLRVKAPKMTKNPHSRAKR